MSADVAYAGGMTPEITDPRFQKIADDIKNDPENASFTKRGIDPLFYAGPEAWEKRSISSPAGTTRPRGQPGPAGMRRSSMGLVCTTRPGLVTS